MIKRSQIARDVRVKLNSTFQEKCLGDRYLPDEPYLAIRDGHVYNDQLGDNLFIYGASGMTSGRVYLSEIDLEFPEENVRPNCIDIDYENWFDSLNCDWADISLFYKKQFATKLRRIRYGNRFDNHSGAVFVLKCCLDDFASAPEITYLTAALFDVHVEYRLHSGAIQKDILNDLSIKKMPEGWGKNFRNTEMNLPLDFQDAVIERNVSR